MDGAAYGRLSRRGAIKTGSELEIYKKDARVSVRKGLDCKTWDCKIFDSKTLNNSAYRGCAKRGREGSHA